MTLKTKKARQRLKLAQKAAIDLRFASNFDEFEDAWLTFLLHAKGVYEQVRVACRVHAKAMQWYGRRIAERKADALLQYIYQSRNFAEHEPEAGARLNPGYLTISKASPGMSAAIRFDGSLETGMKITSLDGKPVLVEHKLPSIELLPVTARGGIKYDPPEKHLGKEIKERTPPVIADICNGYLSAMLDEAEGLKL
jgi:hypothetical protein